jgi:cellobiose-specific phosphotransferase system component IIC
MAISTLTVELGAKPRSGIVNVNGMLIFGMPIGHGALSVFSTTEFVVVPTVYVIIRLQLTDAALSGGASTLSTALP